MGPRTAKPDTGMTDSSRVHVVYLAATNARQDWCSGCLKSSLVTVDVVALSEEGLSVIAEESACRDCETNGGPQPEG